MDFYGINLGQASVAFLIGSVVTGAAVIAPILIVNKKRTSKASLVVSKDFVDSHDEYQGKWNELTKILNEADNRTKSELVRNNPVIPGLFKDPNRHGKIVPGKNTDYPVHYKDAMEELAFYSGPMVRMFTSLSEERQKTMTAITEAVDKATYDVYVTEVGKAVEEFFRKENEKALKNIFKSPRCTQPCFLFEKR